MKTLKLFLILLGVMLLTNCSKNEVSFRGKVKVECCYNRAGDPVSIYAIDNTATPIFQTTMKSGAITIPLNVGNYLIKIYGFTDAGFQIMQGRTTTVKYLSAYDVIVSM